MFTNSPNGLTSYGIPMVDFLCGRAAAKGAKVFWVDPRSGNDGNSGKSGSSAFATMTKAETKVVDERGDVVFFLGTDATTGSSSRDTDTVTWDASGATVVGLCAPTWIAQRARMSPTTSIAGPLLTVSGNNNTFMNFSLFQGHDAASTAMTVSGQRNYFYNIHVGGIGHATAGDDAASESLLLTGSENLFEKCVIGLDTIARSAATAELRVTTAATRNVFRDCPFITFADASTPLFVDIPNSGGIDRELGFYGCTFMNRIDSTATVMTVAMNIHASCGGTVTLKDCLRYGATDWAADFTNLAQLSLNSGTAASDMGAAINGS